MRFARLNDHAVSPTRKHADDAGADVYSCENVTVWPFSSRKVHTGITFEVPKGVMLLAKPKSRSDHLVGAGVIDTGYQGEIIIKVVNYTWRPMKIKKGDAIAQLILVPVICEELEEMPVDGIHRGETARGATGGILST